MVPEPALPTTMPVALMLEVAGSAKLPPLRRLIDNQQEFIAAFEEIISRPHEQEEVLREMTVRCLAT